MNILLYASDKKYFNYIKNVHVELVKRNHNPFFLYTDSELTSTDISKYSYDYKEEVDLSNGILSKSLFKIHLPFVPEILFLARERWEPEQSIIKEFKEIFNTKIVLLELNTNLFQGYESVLEMYSRNQYPQNLCDVYMEHSSFVLNNRIDDGFENSDKSIIVGNPKYDNLDDFKPTAESTSFFNKKYNLDPNKEKILWYANINVVGDECMDLLRKFSKECGDEYEILYKALPGEPYNPRYSKYFNIENGNIEFTIPKVKLLWEDTDLFYAVHLCNTHIGIVTSASYFSLILNKKYVNLYSTIGMDKFTDLNNLFVKNTDIASGETGIAAEFWTRVFNLDSTDELIKIIDKDRMVRFEKHNKEVLDIVGRTTVDWDDDFNFLTKSAPDNKELLNMFDEYNDGKASERIVDEMEKL
jgi:hypothetical protein